MNVSSREFEIDLKERENDAFGKCLHGTKTVRDLLPNQINHSKTVQHKTAPYIQEPCAFTLHSTFPVSVLLGNYYHCPKAIQCYALYDNVNRDLGKESFSKTQFTCDIHVYIILYLVSCNVTYVMEEKSNTNIIHNLE